MGPKKIRDEDGGYIVGKIKAHTILPSATIPKICTNAYINGILVLQCDLSELQAISTVKKEKSLLLLKRI